MSRETKRKLKVAIKLFLATAYTAIGAPIALVLLGLFGNRKCLRNLINDMAWKMHDAYVEAYVKGYIAGDLEFLTIVRELIELTKD